MPAMWDSLKVSAGPSAHQAPGQVQPQVQQQPQAAQAGNAQVPPPQLKKRRFRSQTTLPLQSALENTNVSNSQSTLHTRTVSADPEDERRFWQDNFDSRLNALGIHSTPSRYEIRRGKTVPQPAASGLRLLSPPLESDDLGAPPVREPPPRNPLRLRANNWRPTSSVYDLDLDSDHEDRGYSHEKPQPPVSSSSRLKRPARDMHGRPMGLEISPPSSPELFPSHRAHPEDVSPIDDGPDLLQQQLIKGKPPSQPAKGGSSIPTKRREKRRDNLKAGLREAKSRDRLRQQPSPPEDRPWESNFGGARSQTAPKGENFGFTTVVTAGDPVRSDNHAPTLGQRMRIFTNSKPKAEPLESRPPWQGASGRAPLLDRVQDDFGVAPLPPNKQGLRTGRGSPDVAGAAVATVKRLLPSRSHQKLKEIPKAASPEPSTTPPVLPSLPDPSPPDPDSPLMQLQTPAPPAYVPNNSPFISGQLPSTEKAIRRKPAAAAGTQDEPAPYVYPTITPPILANVGANSSTSNLNDPWVPPPSRFSVTTCNTSIPNSPATPDPEQAPPMPTPPQETSVMDRRRPVPGGDGQKLPTVDDPIIISMKSSGLGDWSAKKNAAATADSSSDEPSTDKALPPPPGEPSANDRVAMLNAKLADLAHRRININRCIKQMTELMPVDSLMSSELVLRKRELEKQKVDNLNEELAEIQREEYDLGLKLYRANKRLERESNMESSSALWVKRATG